MRAILRGEEEPVAVLRGESSCTLFARHLCYLLAVSPCFLVAVCLYLLLSLFPNGTNLQTQLPQRSQTQRFVFYRGYSGSYFVLFILLKDQSSSEQITGLKPTH